MQTGINQCEAQGGQRREWSYTNRLQWIESRVEILTLILTLSGAENLDKKVSIKHWDPVACRHLQWLLTPRQRDNFKVTMKN